MKLITFDKSKNISYFGECKFQFNGPDKCLNYKMLDKDSEETLTSTFNKIFICKNNFLCCLNQNLNNAMIFIFSTKENSEQIFNAILKVKLRQSQTIENVAINEEEIFKKSFFVPLIKAVHGGVNGFQTMKKIILDFVNSLEPDEKNLYFNTLAELSLVPCSTERKKNINEEKVVDSSNVCSSSETAFNTSEGCLNSSMNFSMRKRKNIYYKESDTDDEKENNKNELKKLKKSRPSKSSLKNAKVDCWDEPSPTNTSCDGVIFDIVGYIRDDKKFDKKLLLFTSSERKQCYEFVYCSPVNGYRCIKCLDQKKFTTINATIFDDGSKTFDFDTENHICEPIKYLLENYQSSLIIHSSNFKFVKLQRRGKPYLIMFDSDDENLCYKFGYNSATKSYSCLICQKHHGIKVTARFIQHDGKTAIELNRFKHLCYPVKYVSENL